VGGEKGGVGKSLMSQLLCQWFIDQALPFAALDADASHGALLRGYGDWCHAVDLSVFESADCIMDRALSKERHVVVDLPAQSFRPLTRWLKASNVVAFASEMAVDLVYWHVTDGGVDSMTTLATALPELATSVKVVVVRNHRWLKDFSHLETARPFQDVRERGGTFIELPLIEPQLLSKAVARGASLRTIFDPTKRNQAGLTVMEQRRITHFRALVDQQLGPILQGPAPSAQPEASVQPVASVQADATPPSLTSKAVPESSKHPLPVGTKWMDGAATWTEVSETGLVHHVRYR